jgi:enolase
VIKGKYGIDACNVGDEGGFAPNISRSSLFSAYSYYQQDFVKQKLDRPFNL